MDIGNTQLMLIETKEWMCCAQNLIDQNPNNLPTSALLIDTLKFGRDVCRILKLKRHYAKGNPHVFQQGDIGRCGTSVGAQRKLTSENQFNVFHRIWMP